MGLEEFFSMDNLIPASILWAMCLVAIWLIKFGTGWSFFAKVVLTVVSGAVCLFICHIKNQS